jgi:hypothetical protein
MDIKIFSIIIAIKNIKYKIFIHPRLRTSKILFLYNYSQIIMVRLLWLQEKDLVWDISTRL